MVHYITSLPIVKFADGLLTKEIYILAKGDCTDAYNPYCPGIINS